MTEIGLTHFRSTPSSASYPLSLVRSVWTPEVPFGNEIQSRLSSASALTSRGTNPLSSTLVRTNPWIQSNFPCSFSESFTPAGSGAGASLELHLLRQRTFRHDSLAF